MKTIFAMLLSFFGFVCTPAISKSNLFFSNADLPQGINESGRLNWVLAFVPHGYFRSVLVDKNIVTNRDSTHDKYCGDSAIFLSGGFFDPDRNPEGLLIENGTEAVEYADHYKSGGVMYLLGGTVSFIKVGLVPPYGAEFALQSKPFLWEGGKVSAGQVEDGYWDRISVGTATLNGEFGLVVIGVFSEDRKALRQHQFIDGISEIERFVRLEISWLLNLDGANTAFLRIPSAGIFHGLAEPQYIPSALCISMKQN
ncbi:MAG: hypothetical protein ACPGNV_07085 [Mangrovicoccus sp.]